MILSELLDRFPKLYDYDYKWKDNENYKDLDEVLEIIGYRLVYDPENDIRTGEYNDIKGYFGCEVRRIK